MRIFNTLTRRIEALEPHEPGRVSLYTPAHFASGEAAEALALIRAWPFATLITVGPGGGEPHISHLPLLLEGPAEAPWLSGHLARANRHWQAFAGGHSTAVFHGSAEPIPR